MLYHSGIGRYSRSLLLELCQEPQLEISLLGPETVFGRFLKESAALSRLRHAPVPFDLPIYSIQEQVMGSLRLNRLKDRYDLAHFPHYNVPWKVPFPYIVTVHDLIQTKFPRYFGRIKSTAASVLLRHVIQGASRIITVSKSTQEDLVGGFGPLRAGIHMVPEGVSPIFKPQSPREQESFRRSKGLNRYILYVGMRKPHKNIVTLLRAFQELSRSYPNLDLVLVGKKFTPEDEVDRHLTREPNAHVRVQPEVSDGELPAFYASAELFVLPSLWEGFGLTCLEAMASGCPVIASRASSLPEVVGDAGILFDPGEPHQLARLMEGVIRDPALRTRLAEKGVARSETFSWRKAARQTSEIYREAISI